MITYFELIAMFDKDNYSDVADAEIEPFALMFDINAYHSTTFSMRMKRYWVRSWICTDTRVGIAFYLLDGELVAISTQAARKNNENIEFVSRELFHKTYQFVLKCVREDDHIEPPLVNMNKQLESYWFDQ